MTCDTHLSGGVNCLISHEVLQNCTIHILLESKKQQSLEIAKI